MSSQALIALLLLLVLVALAAPAGQHRRDDHHGRRRRVRSAGRAAWVGELEEPRRGFWQPPAPDHRAAGGPADAAGGDPDLLAGGGPWPRAVRRAGGAVPGAWQCRGP